MFVIPEKRIFYYVIFEKISVNSSWYYGWPPNTIACAFKHPVIIQLLAAFRIIGGATDYR
jgi:hypothetical protein